MGKSLSAKKTFRNKYEHKISKLSDKVLDKLQEKIIRKLCKSFADGLDFYNFSKNRKNKNLKKYDMYVN